MRRSFFLSQGVAAVLMFAASLFTTPRAGAQRREPADRAFEMAMKYSAMGYYMTPAKEGHGGFGVTLEFEVPVNRGLDYVFILAGDRFCQDVDVWVEGEETANTIVKDTRRVSNGLAGVRWRSDYNGNVTIVVHFARVSSRCGWCALVGRRGTVNMPDDISSQINTVPSAPESVPPPTGGVSSSGDKNRGVKRFSFGLPSEAAFSGAMQKDFVAPVEGIAFKYDEKTGSWASAKHAVPSNEKDVEAFLERLGTSLKSARLVPADATLIAGEEGVIRIERASRATAAPVRVPDPKDLGSPRSVPDPRELGSPAAKGGEPPKPKSDL